MLYKGYNDCLMYSTYIPMNVLQVSIQASDIVYLSGHELNFSDRRNQNFCQSSLLPLPLP